MRWSTLRRDVLIESLVVMVSALTSRFVTTTTRSRLSDGDQIKLSLNELVHSGQNGFG